MQVRKDCLDVFLNAFVVAVALSRRRSSYAFSHFVCEVSSSHLSHWTQPLKVARVSFGA